jgi:hypothetical protein
MTLDELERLDKAATPGPWRVVNDCEIYAGETDEMQNSVASWDDLPFDHEDAALVAASRNALAELIKIARAVAAIPEHGCEDGSCCLCEQYKNNTYPTGHLDGCIWELARKLAGGAPGESEAGEPANCDLCLRGFTTSDLMFGLTVDGKEDQRVCGSCIQGAFDDKSAPSGDL